MQTIQVAVFVLTVVSCLCALISVSTDYWLVNEDDTKSAGLFNNCERITCTLNLTNISIATIGLFVTGLFELLFGSVLIFIGWNKRKTISENIGLLLIVIGTIQFCTGSSIFTSFQTVPFSGIHQWGLSFALAWGASAASAVASLLAICVFFKNHQQSFTIIPSRKERSIKLKTVLKKEAYV